MSGSLDRGAAAGCLLVVIIVLSCLLTISLSYYLVVYDWQLAILIALVSTLGFAGDGGPDDALFGEVRARD